MYFNGKERVKEFAVQSQMSSRKSQELSYVVVNNTFQNMEKSSASKEAEAFIQKRNEHKLVQKRIEDAWLRNTTDSADEIVRNDHGDMRSSEYYQDYSLEQLEIILKNNIKHIDIAKYSSVAEVLEKYNNAMKDIEPLENAERSKLLRELDRNCISCLGKQKSAFKSGKARRAIVEQILDKSQEMIY